MFAKYFVADIDTKAAGSGAIVYLSTRSYPVYPAEPTIPDFPEVITSVLLVSELESISLYA